MSYTGEEIFNMSIAIIDELSDTGTINDSQVKEYKNRAPFLLDIWHRRMTKKENVSNVNKITSLSQTLQVSDENCVSGAYFLGIHFALADQNSELSDTCKAEYAKLEREAKIPVLPEEITDVYGISNT